LPQMGEEISWATANDEMSGPTIHSAACMRVA
jgi:hypothetical protein